MGEWSLRSAHHKPLAFDDLSDLVGVGDATAEELRHECDS
jgi:hypothetical protein